MMSIGNWPDELHAEFSQIKRIANAGKIPAGRILHLWPESQSAEMVGSSGELYKVSLDHCDCADFHDKPCKHIYRLAMELGILPPQPSFNKVKAQEFETSVPNEIERFQKLYEAGALSADKFIKIGNALTAKNK